MVWVLWGLDISRIIRSKIFLPIRLPNFSPKTKVKRPALDVEYWKWILSIQAKRNISRAIIYGTDYEFHSLKMKNLSICVILTRDGVLNLIFLLFHVKIHKSPLQLLIELKEKRLSGHDNLKQDFLKKARNEAKMEILFEKKLYARPSFPRKRKIRVDFKKAFENEVIKE